MTGDFKIYKLEKKRRLYIIFKRVNYIGTQKYDDL